MGKALLGELSCPCDRSCLPPLSVVVNSLRKGCASMGSCSTFRADHISFSSTCLDRPIVNIQVLLGVSLAQRTGRYDFPIWSALSYEMEAKIRKCTLTP